MPRPDDDPRWLDEFRNELAAPVPVREEWRARLAKELAAAEPPRRSRWRAIFSGEPIKLRLPVAIAAGFAFSVLGAAAAVGIMWRGGVAPTDALVAMPGGALADSADSARLVEFALSAPSARRVALVGDFSRWDPQLHPLRRDPSSGDWRVTVRLPPGRHLYAFLVDGDVVVDPGAPRAGADDFGPSSVVMVSAR